MCGSEYRGCLLWSCSHRYLWAPVSSFLFQHTDSWKAQTLCQESAIFLPSHLKTKSSGSTLAILSSQVHHRCPSFNFLIISNSSILMTSTIPYIFLFILVDWQALAFIHITKTKNLLGDYKLSITLHLRPGHGMELEIKVSEATPAQSESSSKCRWQGFTEETACSSKETVLQTAWVPLLMISELI